MRNWSRAVFVVVSCLRCRLLPLSWYRVSDVSCAFFRGIVRHLSSRALAIVVSCVSAVMVSCVSCRGLVRALSWFRASSILVTCVSCRGLLRQLSRSRSRCQLSWFRRQLSWSRTRLSRSRASGVVVSIGKGPICRDYSVASGAWPEAGSLPVYSSSVTQEKFLQLKNIHI